MKHFTVIVYVKCSYRTLLFAVRHESIAATKPDVFHVRGWVSFTVEGTVAEIQAGSTVPRRQLGRYLRSLRVEAGLTVRAAAKELERSEPTLWRMESGMVAVRSLDVEQMCRLYGATEDMTKALMALARETKAKGWWQTYGDVVPEWFDLFVGLEAAAAKMAEYEHSLIPGLFQSEGYARTLITADHQDESDAEIARRVELRLGRQAILRRPIDPPLLQVALREPVLRTPVGGSAVMADQLDHLAEVSRLPNVSLRVVPASAGYHPGIVTGSFTILRFPLNGGGVDSEPPTVYQEMYTGALYLDKQAEVERFDAAFEAIWDTALNERSSRDLIARTAEEMRHE
jgi:transcriptional regulator with XRE-family HTH domain